MIEIRDIISTADKKAELSVNTDMNCFTSAAGSFPISVKTPFILCLTNDNNKQLLISGNTTVDVSIPCDRCLTEVSVSVPVVIDRRVALDQGKIQIDPDEEEDTFLKEDQLDVDRLIYDEILVNWPAKVLCKDDCRGICPKCGQNLNQRDCGCDRQVLDPRMAKFQDVFKEFKEV